MLNGIWAVEEAKNDTINVCPGISFLYSLVNKKVYKLKVKFCASILVGLWSKSPSCSFTEQLLLLHSCEWLLLSIYLINKCDKKIKAHEKSNNDTSHHNQGKFKATRLVKLLPSFFQMVVECCTWQAPSPECITVSL